MAQVNRDMYQKGREDGQGKTDKHDAMASYGSDVEQKSYLLGVRHGERNSK